MVVHNFKCLCLWFAITIIVLTFSSIWLMFFVVSRVFVAVFYLHCKILPNFAWFYVKPHICTGLVVSLIGCLFPFQLRNSYDIFCQFIQLWNCHFNYLFRVNYVIVNIMLVQNFFCLNVLFDRCSKCPNCCVLASF